MGDKEASLKDDLCPNMSKITYAVKARVIGHSNSIDGDNLLAVLAEGRKKLRVIPAVEEAPPLSFM